MSILNRLKSIHLNYFSTPSAERLVFRVIAKQRICSMVELGIGTGQRSRRMIEQAQRSSPVAEIRYTGVDAFEGRDSEVAVGLPLIEVHRMLKATSARVQLVPGDPFTALARTANSLPGTDLVLISADQDAESVSRAWFYLPRMLHDASVVLVESIEQPADAI